ncbi:universal stress protein [Roseobacter sp. YSTF-M11]|uniref:Universal stress protein n=1 Tax=Roseobacter insulae TaxID=2859783 RepID=A0A9X1JWS3_9RHOB|nr:universal stress protein [Roseobacter insulae]MBW4706201.1 universal stress protein [Roseobacter insulae]
MINKILLAHDGSHHARRAMDVAAEIAVKFAAELSIVHVLMHGRPAKELVRMAEIEHMVEYVHKKSLPHEAYSVGSAYDALNVNASGNRSIRVISALGDHLVTLAKNRCAELGATVGQTSVRSGDYGDEILDAATDFGSDMIVIGSRGLGVVGRTVLGSVSQKIVHHASQLVVVVK